MSRKLLKEVVEETLAKEPKALYTAIVINENDGDMLRTKIAGLGLNPDGWLDSNISGMHGNQQLSHHMTVKIGALKPSSPLIERLDEPLSLEVVGFGRDKVSGVAAWQVVAPAGLSAKSGVPHVTALLKTSSVKPYKAAKIKKWQKIEPFFVQATFKQVFPV